MGIQTATLVHFVLTHTVLRFAELFEVDESVIDLISDARELYGVAFWSKLYELKIHIQWPMQYVQGQRIKVECSN